MSARRSSQICVPTLPWGQLLLLEDFGVPRLDFVVCEAVLFAQEVDADSTEDYFLAEVRDESRAAVLQQLTEHSVLRC